MRGAPDSVPLLGAAGAVIAVACCAGLPFVATIVLFLLGYLGLVISIFPYLVPPALTIWQTAAVPAPLAISGGFATPAR